MNAILHNMFKLKNPMLMLVFLIIFGNSCNATSSEYVLAENASASLSSVRGSCAVIKRLLFNSIIIDIIRTNSEDSEISSQAFENIDVCDIGSLQEHLKLYSKMHFSVYHEIPFSEKNMIEVLKIFSSDTDPTPAILKSFKISIAGRNAKSIAEAVPKTIECLDLSCQFESVGVAGDFLSAFQLLSEVTLHKRWDNKEMSFEFFARLPSLNKIHLKTHSISCDFLKFLRRIDNTDDAVKAFYLNRLAELTLNFSRKSILTSDDFRSLTKLAGINLLRFKIYDRSFELKNFSKFQNFENAIAQIVSYKSDFENKLKIPLGKPQRPKLEQYPTLYQYRKSFIK